MKLLFIFIGLLSFSSCTQNELQVIESGMERITIRDGKDINGWILAPDAKPDVYKAGLVNGQPHKVTFYTDIDSISFNVHVGEKYDFIIKYGNDTCYTRIEGTYLVPRAIFDSTYQAQNKGKFLFEVPEVYELVNVAIAISPFGVKDKNLVFQRSAYYKSVRNWFDSYNSHLFVQKIDSVLSRNRNYYASLKMNGYSFIFDKDDEIIQSPVYDRTGFAGERRNSLRPYFREMQSFARETQFRAFYKNNKDVYESQVRFFSDTANVLEMKNWLDKNFPGSSDYDTYKIIFSPLVAYNQSSTWFESNGFKELQPHVNFPYKRDVKKLLQKVSIQTASIFRGNIVFTEINHGYINPEADKYQNQVSKAVSNRERWVEKGRGRNYYPGNAIFTEYLNWGLVNLRILDYVPVQEQQPLIDRVNRMMVKNRGFICFEEFSQFLKEQYNNKKQQETIADLYPDIIKWFTTKNAFATPRLD